MLLTGVLLSACLHLLFGLGISLYEYNPPLFEKLEVQFVEKSSEPSKAQIDKPDKQVVEQDDKAINNELDENAKFLSQHNQKVQKQTVAKNRGEFRNRSAKVENSQKEVSIDNLKPQYKISDYKFNEKADDGNLPTPPPAETKPAPTAGGQQASQTIDYIKELDPGLETILSTREFVYYTYYARIRRQLQQFWNPKIKEAILRLHRQGRQIASNSDKITKCLVTLDRTGNLRKIQIIGNSGIRDLDEVAVEAFKLAAPFPNPPGGMIDSDGQIQLRWDFILEM